MALLLFAHFGCSDVPLEQSDHLPTSFSVFLSFREDERKCLSAQRATGLSVTGWIAAYCVAPGAPLVSPKVSPHRLWGGDDTQRQVTA